jgi:hypothetical protein
MSGSPPSVTIPTPRAIASIALLAFAFIGCRPVAQRQPACVETDAGSRVAWTPSDSARGIVGRVVATESGGAIPSAAVTLQPGRHEAVTAADGTFRLASVGAGRYLVRVRFLGREEATDSLSYDGGGLVLLAALSKPPWGLRECARY